jgi:hypothetical protein
MINTINSLEAKGFKILAYIADYSLTICPLLFGVTTAFLKHAGKTP